MKQLKRLKYPAIVLAALCVALVAFAWINSGDTAAPQTDAPEYIPGQRFNRIMHMPGSRLFFERTLEGLEYRARYIVRGRVGDDARIAWLSEPNARNRFGYNLVSLEILEVFEGDMQVGDVITIIEPYFIEDDKVLWTWCNYLPSIPHQEYFFFLEESFELSHASRRSAEVLVGAYWIANSERGRYLVPDAADADLSAFSPFDLSMDGETVSDLYMYLWRAVLDAYTD